MILNTSLWKQTISEAKAKSAGNDYVLRAIDRAVTEIERSSYWAFTDGVLRIKSTTSGKLYIVDDEHRCDAQQRGLKTCKHAVARRLLLRYTQALGASAVSAEAVTVRNWQAGAGVETVTTIKTTTDGVTTRTTRRELAN